MRHSIWGAILLALIGASFLAYRVYSRKQDLAETLAWMDRTYNPHEGGENLGKGHGKQEYFARRPEDHVEEITEVFQDTFTYANACTIAIHSETLPVGIFKTVPAKSDYAFDLHDIDPASVSLKKYDLHNGGLSCSDPEHVSALGLSCDAAEVEFHTSDEIPAITEDSVTTFTKITGADHESRRHSTTSQGWFIVDDVPYAERFAKALRHAIELCGGKRSKF